VCRHTPHTWIHMLVVCTYGSGIAAALRR